MSIITLLTDFGIKDEYVGVMKGVILSYVSEVRIVDLTHAIDPQDIVQGAYILKSAVPYFPDGSIHLAVVDPGVGSARAAVAVRQAGHTFVAPDNGILSLILPAGIDMAVRIENRAVFRHPVSSTFHGRDIFAPAAAYLAAGNKMQKLGSVIRADELVKILPEIPEQQFDDKIEGSIVAIDSFGNLMTNITAKTLADFKAANRGNGIGVQIGDILISSISATYSNAGSQRPVALIGSRNYLEISVNMGNAARRFGVQKGDPVIVAPVKTL